MNKVFLIGNLARDPELRTTPNGYTVCTFTIAVNRRRSSNAQTEGASAQPEADFFRISAWRQLGELCQKYLAKGRKVCVTGSVSARSYEGRDGKTYVSLEVNADDVEFLSPRDAAGYPSDAPRAAAPAASSATPPPSDAGFTEVDDAELPF